VVSAPLTGIVQRVYPIRGEAISPGDQLFQIRLTHEDLVAKQSQLLRAVEELDVIQREVARLQRVTASGAVAVKSLLERQYEQQKTEAAIRAERQALLLHGLSTAQIDEIIEDRQLLQIQEIRAPDYQDPHVDTDHVDYFQVAELAVSPGEHVTAGQALCTLNDHCELYIEGKAFEQDAEALHEAASRKLALTALIEGGDNETREVTGLEILYVENEVDVDSRALQFYVRLPNELVHDSQDAEGRRFIGWRYKPGQRVELLIPVQTWEDQIVLPVQAVVQDGIETYVYQRNVDHFDRLPVHVAYRDQRFAVIEADGTLEPGDIVAGQGAYQIHLALKNKASGGAADAHAGHGH
jgi:biotin carboxyl carrier protein